MEKWTHFMIPRVSKTADNYSFSSTKHLQSIIDAHAMWIKEFLDAGWNGYLFSVMFHQLAGSREAIKIQMKQEVERLYNRLGTRMVRKTRSQRWAGYLPIGVFVPDLPVPKRRKSKKSTIADVSINDGLHMGGVVLGNRWGRVQTNLKRHFEEHIDIGKNSFHVVCFDQRGAIVLRQKWSRSHKIKCCVDQLRPPPESRHGCERPARPLWARSGLMHRSKNREPFRRRTTVKYVTDLQFEA